MAAAGPLAPARNRAIDKRGVNLVGERRQRLAQHIHHADSLLEQAAKVLVDRTAGVGLEMDLVPDWFSGEHSRVGEPIQFA